MKLSGIIIFILLISLTSLYGFEDLGKIDAARKAYPEIFIPGSIHETKVNGKLSYVFMGQSEQCFSGEFAEPESELYEEATLSAKNFFYEKLSEGDKTATVTMSQCTVLYRFNNKKIYSVILCVPKNNVSVSKKPKVQHQEAVPSVPKPLSATHKDLQKEITPDAPSEKPSAGVAPEKKNAPNRGKIVQQKNDEIISGKTDLSASERRKRKYASRLEKNPNDPIANFNFGKINELENDLTTALKYYQNAVNAVAKDEFFDPQEKENMILSTAQLCEKLDKNNLALKYYYLLLKCKISPQVRQLATRKISQIRLKMIE